MNTISLLFLAACVVAASAQLISTGVLPADLGVPNPYSFGYSSDNVESHHSHQETGDGTGRVSGSYSLAIGDGRTRTVNYVADEFGFRADVVTNEPGTESRSPADTTFTSSALPGPDAAVAADQALLGGAVVRAS